ncbi:MAG: cytochrome c oxidase subunit II [Bradyrhizobium sp.]|nr:cytochrome c oxidase subunit II [Bradyrhizobium sp.]
MKLAEFTTAASDYAANVDALFALLSVISAAVVVVIAGLISFFLIRYHRGSHAPRGETPERIDREIEIGWTAATLFTFLFLFWWAASDQLSALATPKDALEIHVVAKQWMWRIQHPNGAREIDELHVPVHTNVRLVMTSQDVIHDLYLPALRLKQDILPDRYTYLSFNATKTGVFHLTCAEFCGTDHSVMAGRLVVMTPEEYSRWNATQPEGDDLAHQGEALFRSLGCSGCHTPGSTVHAPDLHGIYGSTVQLADGHTVTVDEAYLRDCMLLPDKNRVAGFPPLMPNFSGFVSQGQIISLVAYIKSLGKQSADTGQGALP